MSIWLALRFQCGTFACICVKFKTPEVFYMFFRTYTHSIEYAKCRGFLYFMFVIHMQFYADFPCAWHKAYNLTNLNATAIAQNEWWVTFRFHHDDRHWLELSLLRFLPISCLTAHLHRPQTSPEYDRRAICGKLIAVKFTRPLQSQLIRFCVQIN